VYKVRKERKIIFDLDVLHTVTDWGIVICFGTARHLTSDMSKKLILMSKVNMIKKFMNIIDNNL